MNSLEEFVESLNLNCKFEKSGGQYAAILNSSDEYSDAFNTISWNDALTREDRHTVTENRSLFKFTDGYYEVTLIADYDKDMYKIICEEV